MMADARASVLVTQSALAGVLADHAGATVRLDADRDAIESRAETLPVSGVHPDNLAYVIYTSGSTGRPKGVTGGTPFVNRVAAQADISQLCSGDRLRQKTSIGFVDSIFELVGPLMCGQTARIVPAAAAIDVQALLSEMGT